MDKKEPKIAQEGEIGRRLRGKGWVWLNANFTISMLRSGVYFRIYGCRSDGVFIESKYIEVPEKLAKSIGHNNLYALNGVIKKALESFDDFLGDCDCDVNKPCERHARQRA